MKIQRTSYPGWNNHPVYCVSTSEDWWELGQWMRQNSVEYFLLSSGSPGYTFQIRENHSWFALRWV